jgi:hypothetical protein
MTALLIIVPLFMSLLWFGMARVAEGDTLGGAALIIGNMWACTALLIGGLR